MSSAAQGETLFEAASCWVRLNVTQQMSGAAQRAMLCEAAACWLRRNVALLVSGATQRILCEAAAGELPPNVALRASGAAQHATLCKAAAGGPPLMVALRASGAALRAMPCEAAAGGLLLMTAPLWRAARLSVGCYARRQLGGCGAADDEGAAGERRRAACDAVRTAACWLRLNVHGAARRATLCEAVRRGTAGNARAMLRLVGCG